MQMILPGEGLPFSIIFWSATRGCVIHEHRDERGTRFEFRFGRELPAFEDLEEVDELISSCSTNGKLSRQYRGIAVWGVENRDRILAVLRKQYGDPLSRSAEVLRDLAQANDLPLPSQC